MDEELISIREAATRGIMRLRKPVWRTPEDHIKIDIIDGRHGPWIHLYCPFNMQCNGRDPVDLLCTDFPPDLKVFVPYTGPLPESAEYKAAQQVYEEAAKRVKINADGSITVEAIDD